LRQKVVIQVIIKDSNRALLLRRSQGSPAILDKYEFLGGRLNLGEQPEDAAWRYIQELLGVAIGDQTINISLVDVLSFKSQDDDAHTVLILYEAKLHKALSSFNVRLPAKYNQYKWHKLTTNKKYSSLRDSAELIMSILRTEEVEYSGSDQESNFNSGNDKSVDFVIYSDGGSRGNPGPSSAGFVLLDVNGTVVDQGGAYLGITTNNQAEYHGLRLGLERAYELGARRVNMYADSMLVVNQMNGVYSVKNRDLWAVYERIRELVGKFEQIKFFHVPREDNTLADSIVNRILDEHTS
jgi:ribonuclease HI